MKGNRWPILAGLLLIIVGVLALLQALGILGALVTAFWVALFGLAGAGFLYVYLAERQRWWAVIPGLVLLAISGIIALNTWLPRIGEVLSGPLVLLAIALSFLIVYLANREQWWFLIPAGVMASVTAMVLVDELTTDVDTAPILFLGMALTFGLVSLMRTDGKPMRWALIPAAVFGLLGIFLAAEAANLLALVIPVVLIAAGLIFVARSIYARD